MIPNEYIKKSPIVSIVLISSILIFLFGVGLMQFIASRERTLQNRIYPNIYIDNIAVGKKTKEEANIAVGKDDNFNKLSLTILYNDERVATFSAKTLDIHSDSKEVIDRAYLVARTPHAPSRFYQKLVTIFNLNRFDFKTSVDYDKDPINEFIQYAQENYDKPAKNALFTFQDSRVTEFRKEEKGLKIESEQLLSDITKAVTELKYKPENKVIVMKAQVILPEVTLSQANNFGIEELIGEGQSDYSGSIPGRVHNVILAASKFNGVLIPKDKELSFNDIIGDISAATGYEQAYVIKNGRTVLGDGGGVCQISTTLFRAALHSGLPIVERTAHAYRVHYYENDAKPGLDATVFGPTVDFKIKNDTPASILIQTQIDEVNNIVYFKLYGKKDNRRVELTDPIVYDQSPAPEALMQEDPTLKKGVTKQVDWASPGAKSKFDYKVYKGNELAINTTFFSNYRPWQAVFLVGTAD